MLTIPEAKPPANRSKQILVVCTANICRSAMAKGLLCQRLVEQDCEVGCAVVSAGVMAIEGQPASHNAVEVLAERGIDISDHLSHRLEPWLIDAADVILTMEEAHRRAIFNLRPKALGKTFLLSEMAGEHGDVEDPYGMSVEAYRACADELSRLIAEGLPSIRRQLGIQGTGPEQGERPHASRPAGEASSS